MYNKTNVVRRKEIRCCLHCGNSWEVVVKKLNPSKRKQNFCNDCLKILSPWERKSILMKQNPELKKKYIEDKRKDFLKNYKRQILTRSKKKSRIKKFRI